MERHRPVMALLHIDFAALLLRRLDVFPTLEVGPPLKADDIGPATGQVLLDLR